LAGIFAKIDYPDEDLADIGFEEMLDAVNENLVKLKALASTYSTGHAVAEGVPTVILGRTNAGKSSLYNRILGRDAAIVTDIEGTTRDILTDSAKLGRVVLRLSDTAGLRSSLDTVEKIGIDRAKEAAENAELIFAVFDGSREPNDSDRDFISYISSLSGIKIAILNKSDLGLHSSYAELLSEGYRPDPAGGRISL
jgi:tRNA modification GTPase